MADLHLLSPKGFRASGVAAGLKKSGKLDLGLLVSAAGPAAAAAAFSRNRVVSPTLTVGRDHLRKGSLRAVVVNSGNANACTGPQGERDARDACRRAADLLGCDAADVLPSSTGIIGRPLDMPKLLAGLDLAHANLGDSADHAAAFGRAILTTDLVPKHAATTLTLNGTTVTLAGVTKGSGMIGPMLGVDGEDARGPQATMLAYLTTDAGVPHALLRRALAPATERTFNRTTVDGHASTNDTCLVLASGASGARVDESSLAAFEAALTEVCDSLSYQIAADGEGATKVVVVRVVKSNSEGGASELARAIAESPLVKTAMHGNDPNWGRIVSIAGMAAARGGLGFDPDRCTLDLCGVRVFERAAPAPFDAAALSRKLAAKRVDILLDAAAGDASAHVYTCDLSRDYITINADYHT